MPRIAGEELVIETAMLAIVLAGVTDHGEVFGGRLAHHFSRNALHHAIVRDDFTWRHQSTRRDQATLTDPDTIKHDGAVADQTLFVDVAAVQ